MAIHRHRCGRQAVNSTSVRLPPRRNSSNPVCRPLERQNSSALAEQRLTESPLRCAKSGLRPERNPGYKPSDDPKTPDDCKRLHVGPRAIIRYLTALTAQQPEFLGRLKHLATSGARPLRSARLCSLPLLTSKIAHCLPSEVSHRRPFARTGSWPPLVPCPPSPSP